MLAIRFNRSGRANNAFFRVVVTESSKPTKSGFIKILGWYNPHTKDSSLNKEEILRYLDNGAKPSNSVAKLLGENKITHKAIKFIPDAPGKKKSEKKEEKVAKPAVEEKVESSEDVAGGVVTDENIEKAPEADRETQSESSEQEDVEVKNEEQK